MTLPIRVRYLLPWALAILCLHCTGTEVGNPFHAGLRAEVYADEDVLDINDKEGSLFVRAARLHLGDIVLLTPDPETGPANCQANPERVEVRPNPSSVVVDLLHPTEEERLGVVPTGVYCGTRVVMGAAEGSIPTTKDGGFIDLSYQGKQGIELSISARLPAETIVLEAANDSFSINEEDQGKIVLGADLTPWIASILDEDERLDIANLASLPLVIRLFRSSSDKPLQESLDMATLLAEP